LVRPDALTMTDRVLIIEPDPVMAAVLSAAVTSAGFQSLYATSALSGLQLTQAEPIAAILVELDLPDSSGIQLVLRLRERLNCPILLLSANATERQRIEALNNGADHVVRKPFAAPTLLALLRAALRRAGTPLVSTGAPALGSKAAPEENALLQVGALALDARRRSATVGGRETIMTSAEFGLLWTLALHHEAKLLPIRLHKVLDRTVGAGDENLQTLMMRIASKLHELDSSILLLQTPRGRGWSLTVPLA
jgi:DNA-binding response OmpR family regulator